MKEILSRTWGEKKDLREKKHLFPMTAEDLITLYCETFIKTTERLKDNRDSLWIVNMFHEELRTQQLTSPND